MVVMREDVKPLKFIPKNELKEFMIIFLKESCSKLNKSIEIQETFGIQTAKINTISKQDGEAVLSRLSMLSFKALDNYIRNKFESDPKDYNRNIILFQSEMSDNSILLKF